MQVEALFLKFACFPEDVPVPKGVFDALSPLWAGETKRAHLKVRSWVTALLHCSLLKGSLADGVFMVRRRLYSREGRDMNSP